MGLVMRGEDGLWDDKGQRVILRSRDGKTWFLPDGRETAPPGEPGSLVTTYPHTLAYAISHSLLALVMFVALILVIIALLRR